MAGWIKWNKGLTKRSEVLQMAARTKKDRRLVACACMELWEWADDETADGFLAGCTEEFVDNLVGIKGFMSAYAYVGWAEIGSLGVRLTNWARHNGESAKRRATDARLKDKTRTATRQMSAANADNSRTNVRIVSGQSADQIREDKRREEDSNSINEVLSAPAPVAAPTAAPAPAAAAADASLRRWAEEQAKRPDWLPSGKPWVSRTTWLMIAQANPNLTAEQFAAIIREARQSRETLKSPAAFILSQIRKLGGAACGS